MPLALEFESLQAHHFFIQQVSLSMPKVSVIIPSYNRAEFIPATLDSILRQSFTDFEIVFVDDGSTDDTEKILNDYQGHDKRIKYIKQANSERAIARSNGMKNAHGKYIALVDSDDIWYPKKLEAQITALDYYPDIVFCYAAVNRIDLHGKRIKTAPRQHQGLSGYVFFDLLMRNFIPSVTPIFDREAINTELEQKTEFVPYEDWDFWLRLSLEGKFLHLKKALGDYRLHPGQSVKNVKADHIKKVSLAILEENTKIDNPKLQDYLKITNTSNEEFKKIRDKAFSEAHLRIAYWYLLTDNPDDAKIHLNSATKLDQNKKLDYKWWGLETARILSPIASNPIKNFLGQFH